MFSFKNFIKKGLLDAVGKMADYQIILNAAGWHEKGVLDESDLAEIQSRTDAGSADAELTEEESEESPA